MAARPVTLRTILAAITIAGAAIAITVSAALAFVTTYARHRGDELVAAIETVQLAQMAKVRIVLVDSAEDPVLRDQVAAELRRLFDDLEPYATTVRERELLGEARRHADAHVRAARGGTAGESHQLRARWALNELVDVNLDQARAAQARIARWDRVGSLIGIGTAVGLLLAVAGVIVWLRTRAFVPLVRFLGGVAHDLRNPVSSLRLAVAVLGPEQPLPPEPRLRRTIAMMDRQLVRLDRMIGDLLDMARIESGRLELRVEPVDVAALVRAAVEPYASTAARHTIRVAAPDEAIARVDAIRVEQVVDNLVSNAIKYSPQGGEVDVRVARIGDEISLCVADQGVGMSDDEQRRLFAPFERGDARRTAPGTGLGLYVSRRIVEAHGGRITVDSQPGAGARFEVRLPAV